MTPRRQEPPREVPRAPTISDVAAAAGVSVPTVSRVLTGSVPVTAGKRQLVLDAIERLGYRPNAAARALKSGRPKTVAVVTTTLSRYGYATTVQGVEEAARASGYLVVVTVVEEDDAATVEAAADLVLGQSVSGAVVLDFDDAGHAALAALQDRLPVVAAAASPSRSSRAARAYLADQRAASEATSFLLAAGHRTVHHVKLPTSGRRGGRTAGWQQALKAAGIEAPSPLPVSWDPLDGLRAGRLLAADPSVTAVLCGNDEVAIGVIKAMTEAGRSVPGDVSVVGFDDQPMASLWSPALTTVAQDFAALGRAAFGLLERVVADPEDRRTVSVPARLVVRDSAGPVRRTATASRPA